MAVKPLVSWLIPSTFYQHRWWRRLTEFLLEDFPSELVECIFLIDGKGNASRARDWGKKIAESLEPIEGVKKRWKNVRFIKSKSDEFNVSEARNVLRQHANGDILIHRDADVVLIRHLFTRYAVYLLCKYRLGCLGFPSLRNGVHFKPRNKLEAVKYPGFPEISLSPSVNGMAMVMLKSVEEYVGGRNPALTKWGENTTFNAKLCRAGFLSGYSDSLGYWLSTSDKESNISLTDENRNVNALKERHAVIAMLNDFYRITSRDIFWGVQQKLYNVFDAKRPSEIEREIESRYQEFAKEQSLPDEKELFTFKPWECLRHRETGHYIAGYCKVAEMFFRPVAERIDSSGMKDILMWSPESRGMPELKM